MTSSSILKQHPECFILIIHSWNKRLSQKILETWSIRACTCMHVYMNSIIIKQSSWILKPAFNNTHMYFVDDIPGLWSSVHFGSKLSESKAAPLRTNWSRLLAAVALGNEMEAFIYSLISSANRWDHVGLAPSMQLGRKCDSHLTCQQQEVDVKYAVSEMTGHPKLKL